MRGPFHGRGARSAKGACSNRPGEFGSAKRGEKWRISLYNGKRSPVVAFIIRKMTLGPAIAVGIVAALLLYGFVFYGMTSGPWPWFANARNWLSVMTHIVFGLVVAWWYKSRSHPAEEHRV